MDVFRAVLVGRRGQSEKNGSYPPTQALNELLEALGQGDSLIIFPEGTRGRGDEIAPFKSGMYHLWTRRPDVQFVPVYLANLNRVLPKGEVLPVPFISRVVFGPPLAPAAKTGSETKESFLKEAREALCALQHA